MDLFPPLLAHARLAGEQTSRQPQKDNTPAGDPRECVDENNLVEHRRFELLTSSMRTKRATNCANAPRVASQLYQAGSAADGAAFVAGVVTTLGQLDVLALDVA